MNKLSQSYCSVIQTVGSKEMVYTETLKMDKCSGLSGISQKGGQT